MTAGSNLMHRGTQANKYLVLAGPLVHEVETASRSASGVPPLTAQSRVFAIAGADSRGEP
jgi:hypothetical protein